MNLIKTSVFVFFAVFLAAETSAQGPTCGPSGGKFTTAGANVIQPIAESWAAAYTGKCPGIDVTVEGGATVAGAGRVCGQASAGTPVDIGNMSRQWRATEANSTDGVNYKCIIGDPTRKVIKVDIASDGLTVALVGGGLAAQCIRKLGGLTVGQLRWIYSNYTSAQLIATGWSPTELKNSDNNDTTHLWSEIDDRCPKAEIKLAGREPSSGTTTFFRETILTDFAKGENFDSKRPGGYFNSTDDSVVVNYVATSSEQTYGDAIAFFGISFYIAAGELLYAAPIKNKDGAFVQPSAVTVDDGTYNPLSRRIFMNLLNTPAALANTRPFLEFGLSNRGAKLVAETGYVPLRLSDRNIMLARLGAPNVSDFTKAPTRSPTSAPTLPCGALKKGIICPTKCGFIKRLLGIC